MLCPCTASPPLSSHLPPLPWRCVHSPSPRLSARTLTKPAPSPCCSRTPGCPLREDFPLPRTKRANAQPCAQVAVGDDGCGVPTPLMAPKGLGGRPAAPARSPPARPRSPAALGLGAGAPGLLRALLAAVAGSQQDFPVPAPALEQGQQQQLGAGHLLKGARWGQNNNNTKKRQGGTRVKRQALNWVQKLSWSHVLGGCGSPSWWQVCSRSALSGAWLWFQQ